LAAVAAVFPGKAGSSKINEESTMEKVNRTSILSGILIAIGVVVNLSAGNKYIGAMLFSLALLTIMQCGLQLYTGRIGYALDKRHGVPDYAIMLILNFLGVSLFLVWYCLQGSEMRQNVLDIAEAKFAQSYGEMFFYGLLCGVLMFVAVSCKNTVITIFCIMTFILSGYEHCIADFPYFVVGTMSIEKILKFLLVVCGNSAGSILIHLLSRQKGESQ
jgi:formate/nitrite transporter FocA (FNT family)